MSLFENLVQHLLSFPPGRLSSHKQSLPSQHSQSCLMSSACACEGSSLPRWDWGEAAAPAPSGECSTPQISALGGVQHTPNPSSKRGVQPTPIPHFCPMFLNELHCDFALGHLENTPGPPGRFSLLLEITSSSLDTAQTVLAAELTETLILG